MSRRRYSSPKYVSVKRERFPWLLFLVLLASVYFFWFSPGHRTPPPVRVEFAEKKG